MIGGNRAPDWLAPVAILALVVAVALPSVDRFRYISAKRDAMEYAARDIRFNPDLGEFTKDEEIAWRKSFKAREEGKHWINYDGEYEPSRRLLKEYITERVASENW